MATNNERGLLCFITAKSLSTYSLKAAYYFVHEYNVAILNTQIAHKPKNSINFKVRVQQHNKTVPNSFDYFNVAKCEA
ncbi:MULTISPECIES: hypothetical protein [unclassified Colwellia]|uniref:hypothetical protein n=1 Tax=unclassified Colwellia TaxID=196834 RepID=UPI0015F62212|nr:MULTISPECIES: hypothetical protein [unclassified Colwellia]MBA6258122.1 hypothetical protein [Colwellia sp. MB3u-28]MBA6259549.1 hypothetical protein [Colwellia sp. MB3u-41]